MPQSSVTRLTPSSRATVPVLAIRSEGNDFDVDEAEFIEGIGYRDCSIPERIRRYHQLQIAALRGRASIAHDRN